MQNDEQAEKSILEAVRALTEMQVPTNEVTVPMKALLYFKTLSHAKMHLSEFNHR